MITRRTIFKAAFAVSAGYLAGSLWPARAESWQSLARQATPKAWYYGRQNNGQRWMKTQYPQNYDTSYAADHLHGVGSPRYRGSPWHSERLDDHLDLRVGGIKHFAPRLVFDADCAVCRELAG